MYNQKKERTPYPDPEIPSIAGMRGTAEWLIDYLHRTTFDVVEPEDGPPILEVKFPDQTSTFFCSPYSELTAEPHHKWTYGPDAEKYETVPLEDTSKREGFFCKLSPRALKIAKRWRKDVIRAFHERWTTA